MPVNLEGVLDKPLGYYAHLALTSPKIPVDDPRVAGYMEALMTDPNAQEPTHTQFGNNFYLLFMSLDIPQRGNHLVQIYRKPAEKLGEPWQAFLADNQPLLGDVREALTGKRPYSELLGAFIRLINRGHADVAEKLNVYAAHPIGLEAIGIHAWDRLNPLLRTASQRMEAVGIVPQQFYG
jgi:hypothetical protein